MQSKKTSILFVSTQGKESKILHIPTRILFNWKGYFFLSVLFVFALVGGAGFLVYRETSAHYEERLDKLNGMIGVVDVPKIKKSFKAIDESLLKINEFLSKKGAQRVEIEGIGGEQNFEIRDINEISEYYERRVRDAEKNLAKVPLGAPHPGRITSTFGYRKNPFTRKGAELHKGVDFKGKKGDPVRTTAGGTVSHAGVKGGYGNCVVVRHSGELQTLYGHLSKIDVKKGQKLSSGDVIGRVGSTGRSTGPHLHYEVIFKGKRIDPMEYVKI